MFFRRAVATSFLLIGGVLAVTYVYHVPYGAEEVAHYQKLVDESRAIQSRQRFKSVPIEQERREVQKDVWIPHKDLHLSCKGEKSHLSLMQKGKTLALKERNERFQASIVQTGVVYQIRSESAEYENGELHLEGEVSFKGAGMTLLSGKANYKEEEFECSGNVRLISTKWGNKESFALADRLCYRPDLGTVFLTAEKPKRVLFWQEGLSLSAPEVRFRTEDGLVQGIGDAHFSFDLEEKNVIEELFSKYL